VRCARLPGEFLRSSKGREVKYVLIPTYCRPSLVDIIRHKPGPQMCYQIAFCFWLLTFEQDIAEEINKFVPQLHFPIETETHDDRKYDIIPLLTDVAQAAVKEKVIRVIVSTFRGLVTKAPTANLPAMLVAQLLPFVKNLSARKWSDEDIIEDVNFLRDELSARFESLTYVVLL
jgi:V-type H+-transporting ATPase subunit H